MRKCYILILDVQYLRGSKYKRKEEAGYFERQNKKFDSFFADNCFNGGIDSQRNTCMAFR